MLIAWLWWITIAAAITLVFYLLYRYADSIERQEEIEAYQRAQRDMFAEQLESQGQVQEAQWVREGRRWW